MCRSIKAYFSYRILLTAAIVSALSGKALGGDPDLVFRTIKTDHFNVHYHQGLDDAARRVAALCEEIHQDLSILLGWEVQGRTEVVVVDFTDSANGWARASPRPEIRLYVTGPKAGSDLAESDYWLRTLITHEYTHVVHLQIQSGLARVVNSVFGDIYLPNQIQPRWFIEGLAVLNETYQTTAGRIRSSSFKMTIRTAALEGTLLTLAELSNQVRDFPRGYDDYIYGAIFMDYLRTRFGMEKLVEICHRYGAQPIPFGINRIFSQVLGVDLNTAYRDWIEQVKADAEQTLDDLKKEGLTESTPITQGGEYKGPPVFLTKGDGVVAAIEDDRERAGIFRIPLDGSEREMLALSDGTSPVSVDGSDRIFYTRLAPFKNAYRFTDVFSLDRPGADPRRLTVGARALYAAVSPQGDRLAMVTNSAGTSVLQIADDMGRPIKTLVDSAEYDQVSSPAWSKDGKRIAMIVRRGYQIDLKIVDVDTGEIAGLTSDRAIESDPAFDPSGRFVVFSSDRSGIDNIYAYDFLTRNLLKVTNVATGAFSPAVSPDGSTLVFLQYSSKGYDLHKTAFAPGNAISAGEPKVRRDVPKPYPPPLDAESKPYNPLPSFLPRHWMLSASNLVGDDTALQITTAMTDAVNRHSLGLDLKYSFDSTALSARAAYAYGGLGPGLHFGISRDSVPRNSGYSLNGESKSWTQKILRTSTRLSLPIYGTDRNHGLSFGYSVVNAKPDRDLESDFDPTGEMPRVPRQYFRAGVELGWSFTDVFSPPFGISPEQGRALSASVDFYHPALGGDQTLSTFRYKWTEYIKLPWLNHHVLVVGLNGGIHVSDPPGQASFSAGGYREPNVVDVIWNESTAGQPTLRGYQPGSFYGDQIHSLRFEYRMPIWFAESGYETLPFYFRHVQATIFSDNAVISFGEFDSDDWRTGAGAELIWMFTLGYYLPVIIRTGYAYGFMDQGIHEVILILGGNF